MPKFNNRGDAYLTLEYKEYMCKNRNNWRTVALVALFLGALLQKLIFG